MDTDIIDSRLAFYGFYDFFNRRVSIKAIFLTKSCKEQCIYKWYLYSRPFINDKLKNYMWDYLQSDIGDFEFVLAISTQIKKQS